MSNYSNPSQPLYGPYTDYADNAPYLYQYTSAQPESLRTNDALLAGVNVASEASVADNATERPVDALRPRVRQRHGSDLVKHRRTRSGCLTCRLRRVKCDEGRPICERCKKGSRDCTYPPLRQADSRSRAGSRSEQLKVNDSSSSESIAGECQNDDTEANHKVEKSGSFLQDEKRSPPQRSHAPRRSRPRRKGTRLSSSKEKAETLSLSADGSCSLFASVSTIQEFSIHSEAIQGKALWSHLDTKLQHLLEVHQDLNHHHYLFKKEADHFLHVTLIEQALSYDPLLYAVCCFAAYHESLSANGNNIRGFLEYYNKSVTLLLWSLQSRQKHTVATLLTILQLATFEEYLGDWANLLGHQKAAHGILTELYSPSSIVETEKRRVLFSWYSRFDLYVSLLSSYAPTLGGEWYVAIHEYFRQQSEQFPQDIDLKLGAAQSKHKLVALDMAILFAKLARGQISMSAFLREDQDLSEAIIKGRAELDPLLTSPEYLVHSFDNVPALDPDDIVDPYLPGKLFTGPLWMTNFLILDTIGLDLMHRCQLALILQRRPSSELIELALEICRLFETIEYWPHGPSGAVLSAHACLGIAALFLPIDKKHNTWIRRKFAVVESMGYAYPPTLRRKMAQRWSEPDVVNWWLPNGEGLPEIVRAIRAWTAERAPPPCGLSEKSEEVRDMKSIFSQLNLSDERRFEAEESEGKPAQNLHVQDLEMK